MDPLGQRTSYTRDALFVHDALARVTEEVGLPGARAAVAFDTADP